MLGAGDLLCHVLLAPRIGLILLLGLAGTGRLTSSLATDHFALLGATAGPISPGKLMGYLLMISCLVVLVFGDLMVK